MPVSKPPMPRVSLSWTQLRLSYRSFSPCVQTLFFAHALTGVRLLNQHSLLHSFMECQILHVRSLHAVRIALQGTPGTNGIDGLDGMLPWMLYHFTFPHHKKLACAPKALFGGTSQSFHNQKKKCHRAHCPGWMLLPQSLQTSCLSVCLLFMCRTYGCSGLEWHHRSIPRPL